MALTGAAALLYMDEGFADILAKSGLVLFAIAWLLAIVFECCYRIGWRLYPSYTPRRSCAKSSKRQKESGSSAGALLAKTTLTRAAAAGHPCVV